MSTLAFLWRHGWRLTVAVLFLAGVFWFVLPPASFVLLPLMIVFGAGPVNLLWFGIVALVVYYGVTRRQFAFALAPLVFCAGWYVVSIEMRREVERQERTGNYAPPVPPGTSDYRTLIIDDVNGSSISPNVLANGAVDRLIKVTRDNENEKILSVSEKTLVRDGCTTEERNRSDDLFKAARIDECYRDRKLDTVPDGLVIAYRYKTNIVHGAIGCCNELQVNRREQGNEKPLFVWRQGYARVLSYLPFYGGPGAFMGTVQPGIWDAAGGPWQTVRFGAVDINQPAAVKAIYGIGWNDPPATAPSLTSAEVLERAEIFSRGDNAQRLAVLPLLQRLKTQAAIDDRWLRVAATLIGRDSWHKPVQELSSLLAGLPMEQRITFADHVMARLETPGICPDCPASESDWFSALGAAADVKRYTDRAEAAFRRADLALWQYEAALRVVGLNGSLGQGKSLRRQLFESVVAEMSDAFAARAIAFRRVVLPADEAERALQRDAVAAKIDLATDAMFEGFINAYWSHKDVLDSSPDVTRQIANLCVRIARIIDPATLATIRTHNRVQCR